MPSLLDVIVLVVVLISALLAMLRGFVREVLTLVSWAAAAAAAYLLYKLPFPLFQSSSITRRLRPSPRRPPSSSSP